MSLVSVKALDAFVHGRVSATARGAVVDSRGDPLAFPESTVRELERAGLVERVPAAEPVAEEDVDKGPEGFVEGDGTGTGEKAASVHANKMVAPAVANKHQRGARR